MPYLIKDLNDLEGTRNSMGSRLFTHQISAASEPYVSRTLGTGVVVVGQSNTAEFGLLGTTKSLELGVCRNPWSPDHTPSGSSGGAAAAVAAGFVAFAHATDGGGSIRIPAACGTRDRAFGTPPAHRLRHQQSVRRRSSSRSGSRPAGGWLIGTLLAWLLTEALSMDLFRIPFIITPRTYAFSGAGVLMAAVLATLMITRRLQRLDMVSALKTAE